MTKDEISRMAREAGVGDWWDTGNENFDDFMKVLERFSTLVAAAEREACAKVCDGINEDQWALYKGSPPYTGQELERARDYTSGKSDGAEVCAVSIRARGETNDVT